LSWQLVSFLILAAILIAGFVWYERSRPPSQVVALVAALAALAIAGRIAFAAFPNVKPTTDIVIFAGYALGGAPGFAVGALAALVSNFWFGQGPWTPWQMAGWGLCGILGAVLALGVRNAGRLALAATCGLAAVLYGALLNFSLMATYGGDLSWKSFWFYEGRAVPFEIAHLTANVVLALLAGPAMVAMLVRFRERFEWRRGENGRGSTGQREGGPGSTARWGAAAVVLLVLLLAGLAPAAARADVGAASGWLASQQNPDGGFGASPGEDSGAEITCWAMLGLEASGRNPLDVARAGRTPVDFLRADLGALRSPGDLARTILALEGAGVDPRRFGGQNLVSRLLAKRRKDGSYEDWPGSTAFAVIALRAAGVSGGLDETLDWLRSVQNDDGGWGDTPGSPSTADGTGAALQALSRGSKASNRGLVYLGRAQRKGGGFPLGGNGEVNSQSTAWAIQGILGAGSDPDTYRKGGASALDYLAAQQAPDGHYRYSKSSDQTPIWVTGEVLVAAADEFFPLSPPPREPTPSPTSSSQAGGLPPSSVPVTPTEPLPVSPSATSAGSSEALPGHSARSGQSLSGAQPATTPPGVASGEGLTGPGPGETPASPTEESDSTRVTEPEPSDDGSALGAVALGAVAGCLLFGAAWAARRGWMRWRYGL
jgi:energy-coupling factor transport system substrate-specific component